MSRPESLMIVVLVAATIALFSAAIIGARGAEGPIEAADVIDEDQAQATAAPDVKERAKKTAGPNATARPAARGVPGPRAAGPAATTAPNAPRASTQGATRVGVFGDHFELGVHAPITFDGVPLPLAEDPITGLKGYITYVNRQGGINGLKVKLYLEDDRYTVSGGQGAADKIVKEIKPFIIEGTLGIDQIAKVAKAARETGTPYFAGGGPEPEFKDVGMYQIISNYDQYLDVVTTFICKYGKQYLGVASANDIRLGTTTLNSENILPVTDRFIKEISARKCVRTPVDSRAKTTIEKPTEQNTYAGQRLDLQASYNGEGVNLLIPLQDPITTTRQVLEWSKFGYRPKWTIANFAHDGDTGLALFQGEWTGMRVMSGACYYHPNGGGKPYDPRLCAKMGEAHRQWNSLGEVTFDENAGGGAGGKRSFNYNESSWEADGSGGASAYQIVYFWHGAMKSIGRDPTRERFLAALNNYDRYSNLITSPLTFKGSPNKMRGATKFVLLEAKSNLKFRQVTEITPGLVDHF